LLEELQCLVEDAYSTTLTASLTALKASDCFDGDNNLTDDCCEVIPFAVSSPRTLFSLDFLIG